MTRSLTVCLAVFVLMSCERRPVSVSEVLNHTMCRELSKGVSRIGYADLPSIAGARLLAEHKSPGTGTADLPSDDAILIAVSNGGQPSAGYSLSLESTDATASTVNLNYRWLSPPPDSLQAQVITYPCSVVHIEFSSGVAAIAVTLDDQRLGLVDLAN